MWDVGEVDNHDDVSPTTVVLQFPSQDGRNSLCVLLCAYTVTLMTSFDQDIKSRIIISWAVLKAIPVSPPGSSVPVAYYNSTAIIVLLDVHATRLASPRTGYHLPSPPTLPTTLAPHKPVLSLHPTHPPVSIVRAKLRSKDQASYQVPSISWIGTHLQYP